MCTYILDTKCDNFYSIQGKIANKRYGKRYGVYFITFSAPTRGGVLFLKEESESSFNLIRV